MAKQFGHKLVEPRPALVPLTFAAADWAPFAALSGLSVPVELSAGKDRMRGEFSEDLLLTHRGLSGPGVLQISSYWNPSEPIHIDLLPGLDVATALIDAKAGSRKQVGNFLAEHVPARLAQPGWTCSRFPPMPAWPIFPTRPLRRIGESLSHWTLTPNGTEGYRKAEVTRGGVDTRELSSATMMSSRVAGLYFIGEAVDVTGWLGGYNFQWAWASGVAAGKAAAEFVRASAA